MNHRHRSRYARAAWLLGVLAVLAGATGLLVAGAGLPALLVSTLAAVAACVLVLRLEVDARSRLAQQRGQLDVELDRRLDVARRSAGSALAAVETRVERSERDRRQLEIALQMAMLRREPGPGSDRAALDQVRGSGQQRRADQAA
jgi:hypothetical protein